MADNQFEIDQHSHVGRSQLLGCLLQIERTQLPKEGYATLALPI